jgi:large subunit ribosomal protein L17
MRHGKKVNHLGRTKSHRVALLNNLAISLIKAKRIETTLAKAKSLRMFVEPLITKSKDDSTHSRRTVFSYLQDKEAIKILFGEIAVKVAERNGGYTRIIKLGQRQGDNAQVALIELVDYNENLLSSASAETEGTAKRSRRAKSKKTTEAVVSNEGLSAVEEVKAEPVVAEAEVVETAVEVVEEAPVAETVVEAEVAVADAEVAAKDDLKKIEGIGPKIEEIFNAAGILTFAELASTSVEKLKELLEAAGSNFSSHDPGTWPEQSAMARDGKWDELKTWQDELNGGK